MKYIRFFKELGIKNVPQVGGKNASLGEMYCKLSKKGVRVPNGFATTANAYWYFLKENKLNKQINDVLKGLDVKNVKELIKRGAKIRKMILSAGLPEDFQKEILKAYRKLSAESGKKAIDVAVRSSATAEDMPTASFAGQMETFLNIRGEKDLLKAAQKCIASLFTNRAIVYREEKGFKHMDVALSVCVQKMIRSDKACSGVMFSCDTKSGFADVTVINSSWGLGENIVQGKVSPDEFMVFEPLIDKFRPIVSKKLGRKEWRMIYQEKGSDPVKNIKTTSKERNKFTLTDNEVLELAKYSVAIEKYYKRPMDIEWAKDGLDKKLYILQARPETVQSLRNLNVLEKYVFDKKPQAKVLTEGVAIGSKISQGKVSVIKDVKDIFKFKAGQVLVTEMTDPDWVPIMKIASAIVTNAGGRTCHAAIISRELGVPCVVGTGNATEKIKNKQTVTINCAQGETGYVYQGLLPFKIKKTKIGKLPQTKTKIMMNVAEPEQAYTLSFIPNDGVGLAREEFIINDYIGIHPRALLDYKKLKDKKVKKQIDQMTMGYPNKTDFYINKLAEGIAKIASAFYPKDVIVRLSDFKTNEYANLVGGQLYEPKESNPMIGWRGASRYYSQEFKEAFGLECLAIKKVREEMGLDNIILMVPFCRTVEEGKKVLKIIKDYGLMKKKKGLKPLKIYVMCEIPANVIMGDEFAKIFDGFSIGTNDLTQLTLGLDRDSGLVAHIFDERDQAVKQSVAKIIKIAHQHKRKIGICGQAPSDYPGFARFLVKEGIDSISLNPDTVLKTRIEVAKEEKKLKRTR